MIRTLRYIGLLLSCAAWSAACSVPVFAYALRRWEPEVHTLATAREEAWRQEVARQGAATGLNLAVEAGAGRDQLRHRLLREPWWSGTCDEAHLRGFCVSPLRQELSRRLASGETAVWLLMPGGDAATDAAARKLLTERLAYLQRVTELPVVEADDDAAATTLAVEGPPVRLAFSILDLRRDDPAEWVLTAQVLAMAGGAPGPYAVPVYGRARALTILRGESFCEVSIDGAIGFLTGACSCQVKDQNPGWDLLVACDWPAALRAAAMANPSPPLPARPVPETVVFMPDPVAAPAPVGGGWRLGMGMALVGLLAVLGWLLARPFWRRDGPA